MYTPWKRISKKRKWLEMSEIRQILCQSPFCESSRMSIFSEFNYMLKSYHGHYFRQKKMIRNVLNPINSKFPFCEGMIMSISSEFSYIWKIIMSDFISDGKKMTRNFRNPTHSRWRLSRWRLSTSGCSVCPRREVVRLNLAAPQIFLTSAWNFSNFLPLLPSNSSIKLHLIMRAFFSHCQIYFKVAR